MRVPARAVVHIPDTRIEHLDVQHLIRVGILVPYVKPAPLELPLMVAPEPEILPEPPPAPPSLIATRRRRGRAADAKDTDNAG